MKKHFLEFSKALAEDGHLSISIDHKTLPNWAGEKTDSALGCLITVTDDDFNRQHYMLGYIPVTNKTDDATVKLVQEMLDGYGLTDLAKNGIVACVGDAAIRGARYKIS